MNHEIAMAFIVRGRCRADDDSHLRNMAPRCSDRRERGEYARCDISSKYSACSRDGSVSVKHLASDFEFWLTVIILAFGSLIIVIEYLILRRMPQAKPDDALRLFAITFIIVGTLVFVAAGFDSSQIAPAAGLFGTIAGYLLGKEAGRSKDGDQRGDDKAAQQEQRSGS
jgi:hypothetical protein